MRLMIRKLNVNSDSSGEFATFEAGLGATIEWYLKNQTWVKAVTGKAGK